jgi:hypothetical protein
MTGLDLATSAAKGALSLVLLTASGYAQTHKVLTMTPIATAPPRRRRRDEPISCPSGPGKAPAFPRAPTQ